MWVRAEFATLCSCSVPSTTLLVHLLHWRPTSSCRTISRGATTLLLVDDDTAVLLDGDINKLNIEEVAASTGLTQWLTNLYVERTSWICS